MANKEELYFLLESYLKGKLSPKKEKEIQELIKSDSTVAEEYELVQLEQEMADVLLEDHIAQEMEKWATEDQEKSTPTSTKKRNPFLGWFIFALIAILLGLTIKYFLIPSETPPPKTPPTINSKSEENSQDNLPAIDTSKQNIVPQKEIKQKKPPIAKQTSPSDETIRLLALEEVKRLSSENIGTLRSIEDNNDTDPIEIGLKLIKADQLNDAINHLSSIAKNNDEYYLDAQQLLAYIYFEKNDFSKAIPIFKTLINLQYIDLEKMHLYLALAQIANNQTEKGLDGISNLLEKSNDQDIKKKAKDFLGKIDQK